MKTRIVIGAVILLTILSCATMSESPATEFETARLMGMVYDQQNRPVLGMRLELDGESLTESDIEGRFIFPSVSKGPHVLVAEKNGYERILFEFDFLNKTQIVHLQTYSFDGIVKQLKTALQNEAWGRADALILRLSRIKPGDPELLYLTAIRYYLAGEFRESTAVLQQMREAGIESQWIDRLAGRVDGQDTETKVDE